MHEGYSEKQIDAKALYLRWSQRKKEEKRILGDENLIARAWDLCEDEVFYYIMLIGTY
jgi:hypothetical protein